MTLKGISYLITALFLFNVQDVLMKLLTEQHEVIQILTWRIVVVASLLGIIAYVRLGLTFLATRHWKLMILRGLLAFFAFTHYYFALSFIPLANAATVFMTAPLFVTAFSVFLLGERVGIRRWVAVLLGFSAIVYMLNPGSDLFEFVSVLPLISAIFYSFMPILTRCFPDTEHTLTIAFYTSFSYAMMCIMCSVLLHLVPATPDSNVVWKLVAQPWINLDAAAWIMVLVTSVLFMAGVLLITAAYRATEVSVLAPFEYTFLIWATVLGYLVFSDVPSLRTWIAGIIITVTGIYVALRENFLREQQTLARDKLE